MIITKNTYIKLTVIVQKTSDRRDDGVLTESQLTGICCFSPFFEDIVDMCHYIVVKDTYRSYCYSLIQVVPSHFFPHLTCFLNLA